MQLFPRSTLSRIGLVALLGAGAASGMHYTKVYLSRAPGSGRAVYFRRLSPPRQVVAPKGVFFLNERIVLNNASGIIAIVPGTAVRVLSQNGSTFRATDGNVTFDVSQDKLTNDVNRAALMAGTDVAAQEAIALQMAQPSDEFRTTSGKIYQNATVNRVEPDGIILVTNSGVSKVYFAELPQDVQQRFHYDPEAAAAYSSAQAANQAAFQKQQDELRRKLAEEIRKYWVSRQTAGNQPQNASARAPSAAAAREPGKVIAHGSRVDINKHLAFGRVTIVDFYADWCGPCRQVSPHLEQMANTDPEIALRKIDIVDWKSAVAMQYNVHSIPQVNVYNRKGNLVGTVNGADVEQIRRYVAQAKTSG